MQLYAVASGSAPIAAATLASALHEAAAPFTALDPATFTSASSASGRIAYAAVHSAPAAAGARRYRAGRGELTVLYDGLPVEPGRRFRAHVAGDLLEHWDEDLVESLAGAFSLLRVDLGAERAECVLDPLGLGQVYALTRPGEAVLSNSLETIRCYAGASAPDPLAVESFLSVGWALEHRTLLADVEVLSGGSVHTLARAAISSRRVFTPKRLLEHSRAAAAPSPAVTARAMAGAMGAASEVAPPLKCALTAGRDSRVMLGLMRASGAQGEYYTLGNQGETDVAVASEIARRLGLRHRVSAEHGLDRAPDWEGLAARIVTQTDGLSSLPQVLVEHADAPPSGPIGVKAWGVGGEIGRAVGAAVAGAIPGMRQSYAVQRRMLGLRVRDWDGLVTPAATAAVRASLDRYLSDRRAEGWPIGELIEAFYTFERIGRWGAAAPRRTATTDDIFVPFCSREFIEYAFSFSHAERYVEAPHWRLLTELGPELRDMRFENPWRPQRPKLIAAIATRGLAQAALDRAAERRRARDETGTAASVAALPFEQAWFEAQIASHREVLAAYPQSELWEHVDRARVRAAVAGPAQDRAHQVEGLFRLVTLFWWFHARHEAGKLRVAA